MIQVPNTLTPPVKFSKLQHDLYRGSYPRKINFRFLKTLHLRTMVSLIPSEITESNDPELCDFIKVHNIKLFHINIDASAKDKGKNREIPIDHDQVLKILEIILNKHNSPTYIFCNNGGQITSLIVACLRKIQLWSSVSIFNEFVNYSTTVNHNDRIFIENFQPNLKLPDVNDRVEWLWNGLSDHFIREHSNLQKLSFI